MFARLAVCCTIVTLVGCGGEPPKPGRHFETTPRSNRDLKSDRKKKRDSQPIPYLGGRVLHQPRIVNLFWGAWWDTPDGRARRAIVDGLASNLAATSYLALVTQYPDSDGAPDVSQPLVAGSVVVTASEPPDGLPDEALQAFVQSQATPSSSAETIYLLMTPPGVAMHSEMGTSCEDTCAYHNHFSSSGRELLYAIIPALDCWDVCGAGELSVNGPEADMTTLAYSHEVAEVITDPYLDAWTKADGEDEIGDRCDSGSQLDGGGQSFAVQDLWSNDGMLCASSYE